MKFRKLFSVIGLGLFAMATVCASAFALKNSEANMANAEGEKTWMFRAQINLASCSPNYESSVFPVENAVDGVQFHYWGTNVDETVDAGYMYNFVYDYYGVNVSLRDDQTITGAQWILHQKDVGYKYSTDIHKFGYDDRASMDKDNTVGDNIIVQWQYKHEWTDGKWNPLYEYGTAATYLRLTIGDDKFDFVKDPVNNRFIVSNKEVVGKYISVDVNGSVGLRDGLKPFLDNESKPLASGGTDTWFYLSDNGTFDFIINSYGFSIKKYDENDTYIYYVTNSNTATGDYIYSWGASSQFGSFPGTPITDLVAADEAEEITGNGVLHFQGGETPKLIYKINITIGYPNGDTHFMFDNGTDEYKSDEREIVSNCAYWWTGAANNDAANALGFLQILEARRNEVANYSVCNIVKANAQMLVNLYNSFDAEQRSTYLNGTTIYTWADSSKTSETLITVRQIMERLSIIAEVALVDASPNRLIAVDSSTMIIVLTVTAIGVISVSALVIFKKRKEN